MQRTTEGSTSGTNGEPGTGPRRHPAGRAYRWKRALLGRPLSTKALAHERLGKPTALAVFASDNLSSVAYATQEILTVGVVTGGLGIVAFSLVMPITIGILAVLAILLFSYRQTIKAYPSAGGAYIVTKDNLGLIPAQVAGVALLTDYVLTVAVSVAAGIAAVTATFNGVLPYRVPLSLVCIWIIAWGNLRGVRESGRMFAVPTYFFIAMMGLLLSTGLYRAFTGSLHPYPVTEELTTTTGAITVFLILKAFASGGAAVTGVEAISNGVPAFRPPSWKNAQITLVWMGSLLGAMFLGLSFLTVQLHAWPPSPADTVISQVGKAVFGPGILWYALNAATMLILVLAANTAFADFPRLANFHAGDDFMPRQLTKRGHRLVYSNGIIGLAVAASALVVLFNADVTRLIPLYAIGVFTSFTLSQAGMARRHLRLREPGWRRGIAINAAGALTTCVVTIVIAVTKFTGGAWAVMVFVPVLVVLLVRMNRRYALEREELEENLEPFGPAEIRSPVFVVLVEELDHATVHAVQYAKTVRSRAVHAVHFQSAAAETESLLSAWGRLDAGIPLKVLTSGPDEATSLAGYVASFPDDIDVNVIIPGPAAPRGLARLVRDRSERKIVRALMPYRRTRVTLVRDHAGEARPDSRHHPRTRHTVVVLIDRLDRAALGAVRYGMSLGAAEVRGVHAVVDPDRQEELIQRWIDLVPPIPFELIECWDRNIPHAIEGYVHELLDGRTEVTVVLPRRSYAEVRQRVLHDRTSRALIRTLGRYPHVDVAIVPYLIAHDPDAHLLGSVG